MSEMLILSSADSMDAARGIAAALIDNHEAACVSLIPGMSSVYRWEGKRCEESETLLLVKTTADQFERVRARIREMHTYQVPEVIAVPITSGDPDYLFWLRAQVRPA